MRSNLSLSLNARKRPSNPKPKISENKQKETIKQDTVFPEYAQYADRIQKSLYYGCLPSMDRLSLPLTSIMVERFSKLCKKDGLDTLELYQASSVCYDACVTPCSLILAFLYSDRLLHKNPDYLEKTPSSQVFLIAMMVASKYLYDDGEEDEVFNDEWAKSAAILLADLNQAELEFLFAIDWSVNINKEEFLSVLRHIEGEVSKREGLHRGYFTYTDLLSICNAMPHIWIPIFQLMSKFMLVCAVSYTAAVASVLIGTVVAHNWSRNLASSVNSLIQHNRMHHPVSSPAGYLPACPDYVTCLLNTTHQRTVQNYSSDPHFDQNTGDLAEGNEASKEYLGHTSESERIPATNTYMKPTAFPLDHNGMQTSILRVKDHPCNFKVLQREQGDVLWDTSHLPKDFSHANVAPWTCYYDELTYQYDEYDYVFMLFFGKYPELDSFNKPLNIRMTNIENASQHFNTSVDSEILELEKPPVYSDDFWRNNVIDYISDEINLPKNIIHQTFSFVINAIT